MTEEETIPSMMPSMAPAEDEEESAPMTDEEVAAKTQARLQKKLRVGDGEDILLTRRCSIFAFMPMYIIGFMILGIHLSSIGHRLQMTQRGTNRCSFSSLKPVVG